jgi:hypothetical protein
VEGGREGVEQADSKEKARRRKKGFDKDKKKGKRRKKGF